MPWLPKAVATPGRRLHPQLGLPGDGPICETRHRGFVRNIWILSILVAAKTLKQRHARPSQRMHAPSVPAPAIGKAG